MLLALDPSLNSCGLAVFDEHELVASYRLKETKPPGEVSRGTRCYNMAACILSWLNDDHYRIDKLVFEWPQIYRNTKSKGDPNQLLPLVGIGMALKGLLPSLGAPCGCELTTPTPAEWIGQCPKSTTGDPWKSPRGKRIASRLTKEELAIVPTQHDAIDAVGLGLWKVGRLSLNRVFSGAV